MILIWRRLPGTVPERSEKAIAAGCDIILNCWAKMSDMEQLTARIPTMSEKVSQRLERALNYADERQIAGDKAELLAKRDEFLAIAKAAA